MIDMPRSMAVDAGVSEAAKMLSGICTGNRRPPMPQPMHW